MGAYWKLVAEAERDHEAYWGRLAKELLSWRTPFKTVLDSSKPPFFRWFDDGTLNASYNCLDRQVAAGLGAKTAIIFEADDGAVTKVTYAELLARTCKLANAMKARGIVKGDRVVIYMITATAFSIDSRVTMSRGFRSALTASTSTRADSRVFSIFSPSTLAIVDE